MGQPCGEESRAGILSLGSVDAFLGLGDAYEPNIFSRTLCVRKSPQFHWIIYPEKG